MYVKLVCIFILFKFVYVRELFSFDASRNTIRLKESLEVSV